MGHVYPKQLFVVYLKFNRTGHLVSFCLAKSGNLCRFLLNPDISYKHRRVAMILSHLKIRKCARIYLNICGSAS